MTVLLTTAAARLRRFLGRVVRPFSEPGERRSGRLIVCGACGHHLVNPVDWYEADESSWWVRLRCRACAWSREGVFSDDDVKRLERDLGSGVDAVAKAVAKPDRERMEREAEVFIAALARDLIGPTDFARRLPR